MSAMSDLYQQIEEMLEDNVDPRAIAKSLEVPVTWVYEVAVDLETSELDQ